ncbi:hypothetical protein ACDH70_01215 [Xanthomonas axonopodis pv. poinsettiicola]|uniref:hypothetical protein n=1 Tax=Xanthomonas TaxID=338 RepID=UPI001E43B702|nr:hypothetical protein [Xanthomonas codiaei]MCC8539488.1 hypothetical protein [Xanthomonas codiaei]
MTPTLARFALLVAAASSPPAPARTPAAVTDAAPCVEVRIGQSSSGRLSCLNQLLRESVERSTGAPAAITTPANGSALQLGQPTPAALRQRYGQAFGHSLQPQRPPAPRYLTPFAPVR